MNVLVLLIILLLASYSSLSLCKSIPTKLKPALLVVSYDGFKADYLNRNITPNLEKIREMGTSTEFLTPVFPTKTFTNHFTIATVSVESKNLLLLTTIFKCIRIDYNTDFE